MKIDLFWALAPPNVKFSKISPTIPFNISVMTIFVITTWLGHYTFILIVRKVKLSFNQ